MLTHADDFIWLPFPKIKVPLSLLLDIRSLLYALVNVFHPDLDIKSNLRLRMSECLWVKIKQHKSMRHLGVTFRVGIHSENTHKMNVKTNCECKMNDFGAHGFVIICSTTSDCHVNALSRKNMFILLPMGMQYNAIQCNASKVRQCMHCNAVQ